MSSPLNNLNSLNLGDLEVAILDQLWREKSATVKTVYSCMRADYGHSTANTIQSAMERLFRKGLLARTKQGHAYSYTPKVSREALVASFMTGMIQRFGSDPATSLSAFVDSNGLDEEALLTINQLIEERRSQGESK
ncbi:MAG: TrmB family transcriptional regulator [Gammaproteobacteria bacterium]|nr:TrmB family transcriptional regulator [Gammaproteobacteria bacterium]MBJ55586.1 TrmB family transcriptional regulator [Gammaproteobacteria bacterium]HBN15466.1 TrmB family transcriptional regulator [Pseudohongiella sp.]|tara:strand:- start:268 stop:675 length:408 start_codon:yes stop_codon:yes gene_type:complete